MSTPVHIIDGGGTKTKARVTATGQLVTAPFAYDEVANATMSSSGVAYNFYSPIAGKQFVVKVILITAKKDITTDEVVDIYEAESTTDTTIAKSIMQIEMLKSTTRDFIGLNLLISAGAFINAKADDATTLMTIMGYFIDAL